MAKRSHQEMLRPIGTCIDLFGQKRGEPFGKAGRYTRAMKSFFGMVPQGIGPPSVVKP